MKLGELNKDFIAVIKNQGPRANGMPELHKLTPVLGALQSQGYKVGLVTDGRMSGASGSIPAAIHLTPEASLGGPISRIKDGDEILIDANDGVLSISLSQSELDSRPAQANSELDQQWGFGRELFDGFRERVNSAEEGAMSFLKGQPAITRQAMQAVEE